MYAWRNLLQIKEHLSRVESINIILKKNFFFIHIHSSTLVYIRLHSSGDSSTLVYIRLHLSSDSSTFVYTRLVTRLCF